MAAPINVLLDDFITACVSTMIHVSINWDVVVLCCALQEGVGEVTALA